ncbi:MAG: RNA methyltransferase [Acidobacteriota bacterium]|nr:RNA methyltransferase [Acidobacteriota bacterium]
MVITSPGNKTLKTIRRLRQSKGDHILLEGAHLITEALDAGLVLETVLATPELCAQPRYQPLLERLPRPPLLVAARLLDQLADADSPRGLLAVARLSRGGVTALPRRRDGIYLFCQGLQDPGNLGALARVAEAAGCAGLALSAGSVHPNHPRALRASTGSLLRLPVAAGCTPEQLQEHLKELDPGWLALVPRGGEDLYSASLDGALILLLGAEGPGLDADLVARAHRRLTIPLAPPVESLNATVAAALPLFEIRRRRASAASGPSNQGAPTA